MKNLFCFYLLGMLATILTGCSTTADQPSGLSPVYTESQQPQTFIQLGLTLLEDENDTAERLGPFSQRAGTEVPEPPQIKVYSLSDLQKAQIDPLLGQLVRDVELAKFNDPQYQSALFEYQAGMISADLASLAYTPSIGLSNRFLENESSSRTTVTFTQPLFNMELLAVLEEEDSRRAAAQAQMKLREFELVDRVFTAVTNLIKAQEKLAVNSSRVKTLESESMGAKREYELGQGTITDVRDAVVRLEQAKAEQVKLETSRSSAIRSLEQLTGKPADAGQYTLLKQPRELALEPVADFIAAARQFNSGLLLARANQRLAELAALKSKSAFLPSVTLNASRSYSDRGDISNSGVNFGVSVPVNAGTFYQAQIASAKISQAQLATAQTLQKLQIDVEQSHADVLAGLAEVNIRLHAIEAAELGLNATEKSFSGGVRTRLDVLNSVQTLYVVNEQYITSVVDLAKAYLTLSNLTSQPITDAVRKVQTLLF